MRAELVYRSRRNEVVHSLRVYPDLYLCIMASPAREDGARYLRAVELRQEPIPSITTRMFKEAPFGYICQREATLLPKDADVRGLIHPLLLEPFPDELGVVEGEVYLRRLVGSKELIYECIMKVIEGVDFPVIEEYTREVAGEKERFELRDVGLRG